MPDTLVDISQLVSPGCSLDEEQFVLAGRGGLLSSSMELMGGDRPWLDLRNLSVLVNNTSDTLASESVEQPRISEPIQEATGMAFVEHSLRLIASNGQFQLITSTGQMDHTVIPSLSCR